MFLKKLAECSSFSIKNFPYYFKNSVHLNKILYKNFKNFELTYKNKIMDKAINLDKEILLTICNINEDMQNKRKLFTSFDQGRKVNNDFDIDYIHSLNIEKFLDYYLYNHENFNIEQLDYCLYLFCSKIEFTNKIYIKTKNLDQHKTVGLIWDYFLKNYKKIDNINDCNKFLFLFYVYYRKFSMNTQDFFGKYFNRNVKNFFLKNIEEYLQISKNKISTGMLLNILSILGYFKIVNYYEYLKTREDDLEKIPYWTLRRILIRLNSDLKNEKNIRQIINLLIIPISKNLTSLDIHEKSFLLKNLSFIDSKVILVLSMKKLLHGLCNDIVEYFDSLPETFNINPDELKCILNFFQAVKSVPFLISEETYLKMVNKVINSFNSYYLSQIAPKSIDNNPEEDTIGKNEKEENNLKSSINNQAPIDEKSDDVHHSQFGLIKDIDFVHKSNFSSQTNNEDRIEEKTKNEKSDQINNDLFLNEIDEFPEFDLSLKLFKKKGIEEINEEGEFFDSALSNERSDFQVGDVNESLKNLNENFDHTIDNKISNQKILSSFDKLDSLLSNENDNDHNFNSSEFFTNFTFSEIDKHAENNKNDIGMNSFNIKEQNDNSVNNFINIASSTFSINLQTNSQLNNIHGFFYMMIFHNIIKNKTINLLENKDTCLKLIEVLKLSLKYMDLVFLREKIQINFVFSAFDIMRRHKIVDKEFYNFIIKNFPDSLINNIVFDSFLIFIEWIEKYLTPEEKKDFTYIISRSLMNVLKKDYTIYNFYRITNLICIIYNKKRTILTDNLHFELISLIDMESNIEMNLRMFCDFIRLFNGLIHVDYYKNFINYFFAHIKIKELNLFQNQSVLLEFYFSLLLMDMSLFDQVRDKKIIKAYNDYISFIECLPKFQIELFLVVKFVFRVLVKFKANEVHIPLIKFLQKIESILKSNKVFLQFDIDKYMIFYALLINNINGDDIIMKKCIDICDMLFEKNRKPLEFNLGECISGMEKLLKKNIFCKSLIKNFLINIHIYKKLRETSTLKLDDESTFDINSINSKFRHIEYQKDSINEILLTLKNKNIIGEELYNISILNLS